MSSDGKDLRIGLSLSGGGSRAMAFHLGCLRALDERGLLSKVTVISCVSGGSVIGAKYAYSDGSFTDFEKNIESTLRSGLARKALFRWFLGRFLLGFLNFVAIIFAWIWNYVSESSIRVPKIFSRSECFERTLNKALFPKSSLSDKTRGNLQIVLNACELQSKTAFRFSNRGVASWVYGSTSPNDIPVSLAVAASAAYPLYLPAIERRFEFVKKGQIQKKLIVLTDGGIYENMGVTPLFPGRDSSFGLAVEEVDFIIACDAGNGVAIDRFPSQWTGNRLFHAFDSIMRRTQAFNFQLLHEYRSVGAIRGFILAYLAQDDSKLEPLEFGFTTRKEAGSYGTNFSAMSDDAIKRISGRGRDVMTNLLLRYFPS